MKISTIIKMILVPFIGLAIYEGHKNFFNSVPEKIKAAIPPIERSEETTSFTTTITPNDETNHRNGRNLLFGRNNRGQPDHPKWVGRRQSSCQAGGYIF